MCGWECTLNYRDVDRTSTKAERTRGWFLRGKSMNAPPQSHREQELKEQRKISMDLLKGKRFNASESRQWDCPNTDLAPGRLKRKQRIKRHESGYQ